MKERTESELIEIRPRSKATPTPSLDQTHLLVNSFYKYSVGKDESSLLLRNEPHILQIDFGLERE